MTKRRNKRDLTADELAEANGEPLPDRHALSVIRAVQPLPEPVFPIDQAAGGYHTIDPLPPDEA
jgi:hypothetical protein